MSFAVHFDGQLAFAAREVREKWPNGMLTAELDPRERPITQVFPQDLLGGGQVVAKLPGTVAPDGITRHRWAFPPHPRPLPPEYRGRGEKMSTPASVLPASAPPSPPHGAGGRLPSFSNRRPAANDFPDRSLDAAGRRKPAKADGILSASGATVNALRRKRGRTRTICIWPRKTRKKTISLKRSRKGHGGRTCDEGLRPKPDATGGYPSARNRRHFLARRHESSLPGLGRNLRRG